MRRALLLAAVAVAALWAAPGAFASGWCGSGETPVDRPDVITGQQLHAVIAVPSDGADTFASLAGQMSDDVTSMVTWWQGQDPTRIPRYDQAVFGTSSCLDISFVRLPDPASSYAGSGASNAFTRVSSQLGAAGLTNIYKKYLVYFDGPSVQDNVCGTGGGDFSSGGSYAIVWLQGCPGVPTDSVATHELLHALGALPIGAPHACPASQGGSGHPCDSPTDVLYPYTTGAPLSAQVLDFNHDDYYGHGGSWDDIQDSLWLHRLDAAQVALTVGLVGGGAVQSDLPGVDCAAACTTQWDSGTLVSLSAVPAKNDRFVRWTGGCTGNADCALTLAGATSATAVFGPLLIPVRISTSGKGTVSCTPRCTKTFSAGDPLTLRAVATKGWRFSRWSGACRGTRPVCRPATDYALSARADFTRRR